jgi:hypothetical protein
MKRHVLLSVHPQRLSAQGNNLIYYWSQGECSQGGVCIRSLLCLIWSRLLVFGVDSIDGPMKFGAASRTSYRIRLSL